MNYVTHLSLFCKYHNANPDFLINAEQITSFNDLKIGITIVFKSPEMREDIGQQHMLFLHVQHEIIVS